MKLYVVLLRYVRPLPEVDLHLEAHRAWLREGYRSGRLLVSGPRRPREGGVVIARATELAEVRAMLDADPFRRNGVAEYDIVEFEPSMHDPQLAWALEPLRSDDAA